jgi:hypothetical protein
LAEFLARGEMKGVVYAEGFFRRYEDTHWQQIQRHELSAIVRKLSGMPYGEGGKISISGPRIRAIIEVLSDILAEPEFFRARLSRDQLRELLHLVSG